MSYNRKQFDKQKLKKLAKKTASWYGGGAYYDKRKCRYIRTYKSNGKHSMYAYYKRYARKKTVPMVRSMVSTPKTPKTSFGTCGNYALAFINIKLSEGIY